MSRPRLLVVAATDRELGPAEGWTRLVCGVGPVEAAVHTAAAIARERPDAILHVGIAGARRAAGLAPCTLVIGTDAHYVDLSVPPRLAPRQASADAGLVDAARRALPDARVLPIATTAAVGALIRADSPCIVEAMEGFAVLRAAHAAGVPAIEVRAIANEIEETDRAKWHFDAAFAAIVAAVPLLARQITDPT